VGVTELAHVLVLSDDIDAARDFYCRAVGMTVGERPPLEFPGYWLYAEGKPCLHIADRTTYNAHAARVGLRAPDEQTRRVDHIAFEATDYEELAAQLQREGVTAVRRSIPEADLRQLYFDGPDGVRIEVNVVGADHGSAAPRSTRATS
jgi:catechol 2,3-dioxygenase-like lactoylglutathione lyase family enzyme